MTQLHSAEPRDPNAAPVLHDAVVGGDNIQITSARDVTIVRRPVKRRSLLRLLSAGAMLVICAVAASTWPTLTDWARDVSGAPVLSATATTWINVGDHLATQDKFSPTDHALLLRGPDDGELTQVLSRHRAARVGSMNVVVILQGQRNAPIRIIDVRPRIIRSDSPPTGTCLTIPAQGEETEYKVKADLDTQRPDGGGSRFLPTSIDLAYGERATIEFTAKAKDRWYEWDIEVVYAYKAGHQTESAFYRQADGQPFRLTGAAPKYATVWNDPSSIGVGFRVTGKDRQCFKP